MGVTHPHCQRCAVCLLGQGGQTLCARHIRDALVEAGIVGDEPEPIRPHRFHFHPAPGCDECDREYAVATHGAHRGSWHRECPLCQSGGMA